MTWWQASPQRVVLAVRPIDERACQLIRKGPFLVECAVVVGGQPVPAFDDAPALARSVQRSRSQPSHLRSRGQPA